MSLLPFRHVFLKAMGRFGPYSLADSGAVIMDNQWVTDKLKHIASLTLDMGCIKRFSVCQDYPNGLHPAVHLAAATR